MPPRPCAQATAINTSLTGRVTAMAMAHLVWASLGLAAWWALIGG